MNNKKKLIQKKEVMTKILIRNLKKEPYIFKETAFSAHPAPVRNCFSKESTPYPTPLLSQEGKG